MTAPEDMAISVGLLDFWDPNKRVAWSTWGNHPRWIPQGAAGYSWAFYSYRGRPLGYLFRENRVWFATKACCNDLKEFGVGSDARYAAAAYVESSLHCTECGKSCLVPRSN